MLLPGAVHAIFCGRPFRSVNGFDRAVHLVRVWGAEKLQIGKPAIARTRKHNRTIRLPMADISPKCGNGGQFVAYSNPKQPAVPELKKIFWSPAPLVRDKKICLIKLSEGPQ